MKLTVVLHNIRSTYNVGAILRTAEGLGVEKVIFSGYTPRYDDSQLLPHLRAKLNRQIEKSALGAEKLVSSGAVEDLQTWLTGQRGKGEIVVGLENNLSPEETRKKVVLGAGESAMRFFETISQATAENEAASARDESGRKPREDNARVVFRGDAPESERSEDGLEERRVEKNSDAFSPAPSIILILGEEVEGIPTEIRKECDYFLEIPMRGKKESFNVSVAAGIAMWGLTNFCDN